MRRSMIEVDKEQREAQPKTLDDKTREQLHKAKQKGTSVWRGIGGGLKAVAGFRLYMKLPDGAKNTLHEMYRGSKPQRSRPSKPFPSMNRQSTKFSGWLNSNKRRRR